MKIQCEMVSCTTNKKGDKITIFIEKEHREEVVKHLLPFLEKPVTLEVLIDSDKVLREMNQISDDQRKLIYSTIKDFSNNYGDTAENVKLMLKENFFKITGERFSLSNCTNAQATQFIDYLNSVAHEFDVSTNLLKELQLRLYHKNCFVCNASGKVYANGDKKICLCGTHLEELNRKGYEKFCEEQHVEAI